MTMGLKSSSASALMADVNEKLDVQVPVTQLFETPTIQSLASHIRSQCSASEVTVEGVLVDVLREHV